MKNLALAAALACALGLTFTLTSSAATTAMQAPTVKPARQIDIMKSTCNDLLQAEMADRASAMMFYWGYVAGKQGMTVFNTADLRAATGRVMDACVANPKLTILDAIAAATKHGK